MTPPEKVAENLIRKYGEDAFHNLLGRFKTNDNNQEIATAFTVSRERVRQWKNVLGRTIVLYEVTPSISHLLGETHE
jgi:hypothetical protein